MSSKNDLDPNQPAPPPTEAAAARVMAYTLAMMYAKEYPDASTRELARAVAFFVPEAKEYAEAMAEKVRTVTLLGLKPEPPIRPISSD